MRLMKIINVLIKNDKIMNLLKKIEKHNINYTLLILFLLIVVVGFVMLFSSSIIIAEKKTGDQFYYIKHQLFAGIIPSIILFLFFSFKLNYKIVKKFYLIVFLLSFLFLIAVLIPGIGSASGGARSWIYVFDLFSFQPAEVMKIALIVLFAVVFEKLGSEDIKDFKQGFIPFVVVLILVGFLLLLQPDLGTLSIIFVISFVMFFIAGGKIRHLLSLLVFSIAILALFLKIDQSLTGGIRTTRIRLFLNPEQYSKRNEGYHINQAMIAVGTGGLFGRGIGNSVQKFSYLPEVMADSIFAVIAEELGFVLTSIFLFLYFYFIKECLSVAKNAPDDFSRFFVIGVVSWISFQVFVNVGAMVRLYPLTGVPLPLVSYGGTSMCIISTACGIIVNISKYSTPKEKLGENMERKSRVIINKE